MPLIIWGEPSAEYTAYFTYDQVEEVDEKRFNRYVNLGISADDMFVRLGGAVDRRDLKPYTYPPLARLRAQLPLGLPRLLHPVGREAAVGDHPARAGLEGRQVESVPPEYHYEKIECYMQGVRDYIKYIKRGYSRPSHLVALDVRNGRMTKDEGEQLDRRIRGRRPPSLDLFLEFIGLTEEEFLEIAMTHRSALTCTIRRSTRAGAMTADFERWSRDGAMARVDAEQIVYALAGAQGARRSSRHDPRRPRPDSWASSTTRPATSSRSRTRSSISAPTPCGSRRNADFAACTHLVLPGVGAFGFCAEHLHASGLRRRAAALGARGTSPLLGICVGMQLLADESEESPRCQGLGWIGGVVRRWFPRRRAVRVPHVGWNTVEFDRRLRGVRSRAAARTSISIIRLPITSPSRGARSGALRPRRAIQCDRPARQHHRRQFHPEKSQTAGMRFLSRLPGQ